MRTLPFATIALVGLAAILSSCSHSDSRGGGVQALGSNSGATSSIGRQPTDPHALLEDPHQGGSAPSLSLMEMSYGRLVDVFDKDVASGERRLIYTDVVIGPSVMTDGIDYVLGANLAQGEELTILHEHGTLAFNAAFKDAENQRVPIQDNGLPPALPPWAMVPRNAALSLRFDDLLDPQTVTPENLRLEVGYPTNAPFQARVIPDPNHGAVLVSFYPTRVIVDLTVSEVESAMSAPPLPVNGAGLPLAQTVNEPNVALRIPTVVAPVVGQTTILSNLAGNGLTISGYGASDPSAPTQDLVCAFRSGGPTGATTDPHNGALPDVTPPRIVAELPLVFDGAVVSDSQVLGGYRALTATFFIEVCSPTIQVGDLICQEGLCGVVYSVGSQVGPAVQDLRFQLLYSNSGPPTGGLAKLTSAYDPNTDNAECFVSYGYTPTSTLPNMGLSPATTATVRFSEPMSMSALDAFYGVTLTENGASPAQSSDLIAGELAVSPSYSAARFTPLTRLAHTQGIQETYHVHVGDHPTFPLTDLAGLPLADPIAGAEFMLEPTVSSSTSHSLVLRFDSDDMLGADGFKEFRGQFTPDVPNEQLVSRSVSRFQGAADATNPLPGVMTAFAGGVQTPLVGMGSKLQQLWRYADFGMSLMDESMMNLDVEGLSWSPNGGVFTEIIPEFSITLGHARQVPDEKVDVLSGLLLHPNSGIGVDFAANILGTGQVVHEKGEGYLVTAADAYLSAGGTTLMPYPLNRSSAIEDYDYWTWRDTAVPSVGGNGGSGVPLDQEIQLLGLGPDKDYGPGAVPTIGLPLLAELRCYPSAGVFGINSLSVLLGSGVDSRPNFRAYSSGGTDTSGVVHVVDPDTEPVASGGFNPGSMPPGAATAPADNTFYVGAVDFVTTKSRAHSIWIDVGTSAMQSFLPPVILGDLPPGTDIELAFRGADSILGGTPGAPLYIGQDADGLDPYGDPVDDPATGTPVFFLGPPGENWTSDITDLNGSTYLQVRITFVGNPVSLQSTTLRGIGLCWTE